uniref:Uncharacterized protein n=1 Tax=Ciona savignyi TaxID=51511 RepID=H2Y6T2_CIOSA
MTYNPTANQVFVLNPCPQSVKPPLAPYNPPAVLRSPQTVIPTPAPPTTCPITLPSTNASQNVTWNHIPNIQCTQIPTKLQGNYLSSPVAQFYPQIWGSSQTYQQPMAFHSPAIHTTQNVSKSTINTSTTPFQTSTEKIHETVLKQRQLIGKLITFIIHDRLRHDQKHLNDVTDDVDKLLTSHFDLLNDISFEAMSAIRLYKARKTKGISRMKTTKRTRTVTSEKRFRRKRHRKWTRSPPHRKSCDTSS